MIQAKLTGDLVMDKVDVEAVVEALELHCDVKWFPRRAPYFVCLRSRHDHR